MPRVYELIDLIEDRSNSRAYFQDFEQTICSEPSKRQVWVSREVGFSRLDNKSWQFLKEEALPYLESRDSLRGWAQLISILNQARGYNFLVDEGYSNVHFIPKSKTAGVETPDLEASEGSSKVFCEIKSIQFSQKEAKRRASGDACSLALELESGFFNKLKLDFEKAKSQMCSFNSNPETRYIAFVDLEFDDFLGEYKNEYFKQIDGFLESNPVLDMELVFYNPKTAFNSHVELKYARVINEVGS